MKKSDSCEFPAKEKILSKVENILRRRSARSLELAREHILNLKIESPEARRAIELYAENLDDITHPGILSLACEAVGGKREETLPLQIAILLLTAMMDLHDDIIDRSKIKNGLPTVFGQFGEKMAILIGDAFFLEGFILLIKNARAKNLRKIIEAVEHAYFEVGNGHLLEIAQKGRTNLSPERYLEILQRKAWNIGVHAQVGAIIGDGTPDEIRALKEGGRILGVLITLREELIDIFEPKELLNRFRNECLPLPLLYAFRDPYLKRKILDVLAKQRISKKDVSEILSLLMNGGVIEKFKNRMEALSVEAIESISCIKNQRAKKEISELISATLEDI